MLLLYHARRDIPQSIQSLPTYLYFAVIVALRRNKRVVTCRARCSLAYMNASQNFSAAFWPKARARCDLALVDLLIGGGYTTDASNSPKLMAYSSRPIVIDNAMQERAAPCRCERFRSDLHYRREAARMYADDETLAAPATLASRVV